MAFSSSHLAALLDRLRHEIYLPRARLFNPNQASISEDLSRRAFLQQPLSAHIDGTATRPYAIGGDDLATIDRDGPYIDRAPLDYSEIRPYIYDDLDTFTSSNRNPHHLYSFPFGDTAPRGIRWGPEEIHAYNSKALLHNASIARRKSLVEPYSQLMYPIMDSQGRFPSGFDRPMRYEDFLLMEEPIIESHRQHFGLPMPEALEDLLLLNSAEHQIKRQLKKVQLLEFYGAKRLAEQFALQFLAIQGLIPGLSVPGRSQLGIGLGPEFDDTYLSSLQREGEPSIYSPTTTAAAVIPFDAIGYGNGLANWNFPSLFSTQFRDPRISSAGPWGRAALPPSRRHLHNAAAGRGTGIHSYGPGVSRSHGYQHYIPALPPSLPYRGGSGGSGRGGWVDRGPYGISGPARGGIPSNVDRLDYEGGGPRHRRAGRFN